MSSFDDREKAEESRYARTQESEFKAVARRNKLVGAWAAGLMGLTGEEADAYAKTVVVADFEEAGDEDVFRKLRADLDKAGVEVSDHVIRREMSEQLEVARAQLAGG
jgi:hypothetical protein